MNAHRVVIGMVIMGAALTVAPKAAHAEDCLEVGWRDQRGEWTYHRAHIDAEDGNKLYMHYDFHHGQLELKVYEKEKGDGEDVIVFRGRWFEGRDAQRSGKVRMELKKGHHTARGWYTFGEDPTHYDFKLRECR